MKFFSFSKVSKMDLDMSVAAYLKNQGYHNTLDRLLTESPHLRGRQMEDIGEINFDAETLVLNLRKTSGVYSLLTQSINQIESGLAAIRYGLRLSNQIPSSTASISMQPQLYNETTSVTLPKRRKKYQRLGRSHSDSIAPAPPPPPTFILVQTQPSTSNSNSEQDIMRNQEEPILQPADELLNPSTPNRRQLFSSPSKRKTPNPKHQRTPVVERDLLDEALRQCSISPADWDRRVTDSIVPEQLAAAINNARINSCNNTPQKNIPNPSPAKEPEAEPIPDTDVVITETLNQIQTDPDFFQSLEQLFAPEYNDPHTRELEDDVNRFNDLHTPEPSFLDDSDLTSRLAIADLSAVSTLSAQSGFTFTGISTPPSPAFRRTMPNTDPRSRIQPTATAIIKEKRNISVNRSLFHENGEHSRSEALRKKPRHDLFGNYSMPTFGLASINEIEATNGHVTANGIPTTSSTPNRSVPNGKANGHVNSQMITPDRIDALMKRLHRKT